MKWCTTEKNQFLFLRDFLLVLTKFLFWKENWAIGWMFFKSLIFFYFSQFPQIVSLNLFGTSWGNSYIPWFVLIMMFCFFCRKENLGKHQKESKYFVLNCSVQSSFQNNRFVNNTGKKLLKNRKKTFPVLRAIWPEN